MELDTERVNRSLIHGEAFAQTIIHAETKRKYDPVKRREYYLRTRELKGRKRGSKLDPIRKMRSIAKIDLSLAKLEKAEKKFIKDIDTLKKRIKKLDTGNDFNKSLNERERLALEDELYDAQTKYISLINEIWRLEDARKELSKSAQN